MTGAAALSNETDVKDNQAIPRGTPFPAGGEAQSGKGGLSAIGFAR
jgi:hypothetical protein